MAKTICQVKHAEKNRCRKEWWQGWKSVLQVNKQSCSW